RSESSIFCSASGSEEKGLADEASEEVNRLTSPSASVNGLRLVIRFCLVLRKRLMRIPPDLCLTASSPPKIRRCGPSSPAWCAGNARSAHAARPQQRRAQPPRFRLPQEPPPYRDCWSSGAPD